MAAPIFELEGTWEEVAAHAAELAGRRVRLTVLPSEAGSGVDRSSEARVSTAASLLKYAGTWEGDDLEECLEIVRNTRSPVEFKPSLFDRDKG